MGTLSIRDNVAKWEEEAYEDEDFFSYMRMQKKKPASPTTEPAYILETVCLAM